MINLPAGWTVEAGGVCVRRSHHAGATIVLRHACGYEIALCERHASAKAIAGIVGGHGHACVRPALRTGAPGTADSGQGATLGQASGPGAAGGQKGQRR